MKNITLFICLLPLFCCGQDQITLLDGKTYDVKITKQNSLNIHFYVLSDSLEAQKVILKELLLSYKIEGSQLKASKIMSAGDELITAATHWYLGFGAQVIGMATMVYSTTFPEDGRNVIMITGGIISLAGLIFIIESHSHIVKSGRLMNKDKLSITFNNGIGLRYRI